MPTVSPDITPRSLLTGGRGWLLPLAVGLYAGLASLLTLARGALDNDWRFFWTAGRAMLEGGNPFQAVAGLGARSPLYYPGPALVMLAPFGLLSMAAGFIAFALVSGIAFGFAAKHYGRGLYVGALSACFLEAITYGQWSPILVAAAVIPALGPLLTVKPSIGAALWVWRPRVFAVIGGLALLILSILILPSWPRDWWAAVERTNHIPPLMRPGGFLLLLALLRWRTPEARLLLALAFIPQTTGLYESLLLFLIPRTRQGGYVLVAGSFVVAFVQALWTPSGLTIEAGTAQRWPLVLGFLYLPALAMTLRRPDAPTSGPIRHQPTCDSDPTP